MAAESRICQISPCKHIKEWCITLEQLSLLMDQLACKIRRSWLSSRCPLTKAVRMYSTLWVWLSSQMAMQKWMNLTIKLHQWSILTACQVTKLKRIRFTSPISTSIKTRTLNLPQRQSDSITTMTIRQERNSLIAIQISRCSCRWLKLKLSSTKETS